MIIFGSSQSTEGMPLFETMRRPVSPPIGRAIFSGERSRGIGQRHRFRARTSSSRTVDQARYASPHVSLLYSIQYPGIFERTDVDCSLVRINGTSRLERGPSWPG